MQPWLKPQAKCVYEQGSRARRLVYPSPLHTKAVEATTHQSYAALLCAAPAAADSSDLV